MLAIYLADIYLFHMTHIILNIFGKIQCAVLAEKKHTRHFINQVTRSLEVFLFCLHISSYHNSQNQTHELTAKVYC